MSLWKPPREDTCPIPDLDSLTVRLKRYQTKEESIGCYKESDGGLYQEERFEPVGRGYRNGKE